MHTHIGKPRPCTKELQRLEQRELLSKMITECTFQVAQPLAKRSYAVMQSELVKALRQ